MTEAQTRYIELLALLNYCRMGKETNLLNKGRFFYACATDLEHVLSYFRTYILTVDEVDGVPPIPMAFSPFPV